MQLLGARMLDAGDRLPLGRLADGRDRNQRRRARLAERDLERAVERAGDELGGGLLLLEDPLDYGDGLRVVRALRQAAQEPVGGDLEILEGERGLGQLDGR